MADVEVSGNRDVYVTVNEAAAKPRDRRVMVVDDCRSSGEFILTMAEWGLGVKCQLFTYPTAAIEALMADSGGYCGVITDLYLDDKNLDGLSMVQAMWRIVPAKKLPVLFVTALNEQPIVQKMEAHGDYCCKPITKGALQYFSQRLQF